jgi:hypothetical protein
MLPVSQADAPELLALLRQHGIADSVAVLEADHELAPTRPALAQGSADVAASRAETSPATAGDSSGDKPFSQLAEVLDRLLQVGALADFLVTCVCQSRTICLPVCLASVPAFAHALQPVARGPCWRIPGL